MPARLRVRAHDVRLWLALATLTASAACVKTALGPIARPDCPRPIGDIAEWCRVRFERGGGKSPKCPSYAEMVSELLGAEQDRLACPYGFVEGECGPYRVIHVSGRFGGTDHYFDAHGRLVGEVHWMDIVSPCDPRASDPEYHGPLEPPGESRSSEIGTIPQCSGVWTRRHCVETLK